VLSDPLFNGPETIAYDEENNQYFVGNATDGKLLIIDSLNAVTVFKDNIGADVLMDLLIVGDSLFISANDPASLTCLDKNTGATIYQIILEDIADACSQMVYDSRTENIYIAEQYGKILKADINTQNYHIFASAGVPSGTTTVEIDTSENRLILFSWSSSYSKYLNLDDSTDIYNGPSIGTLQNTGSMMDNEGYIYVSSWVEHEVIRAHVDSLDNAQVFCDESLFSPVGITQNANTNTIAISNYGNNTVSFICDPDTITGIGHQLLEQNIYMNLIYTPGSKELVVNFDAPKPDHYHINVYDVSGRIHISKAMEAAYAGPTSFRISIAGLREGIYLVQMRGSEMQLGAGKIHIK
jgi:hypothetical protein